MLDSGLPEWKSVLAVVAHPDDESFGLGAVLSAFIDSGARVCVLCFTRGEASTLGAGDLSAIRSQEFVAAADALGVTSTWLGDYPDGHLEDVGLDVLVAEVGRFADIVKPDGIVAFDSSGVTGHPDHQRATEVAVAAAQQRTIGVLGWTLPSVVSASLGVEFGSTSMIGHAPIDIDLIVTVDRLRQLQAVHCHASQAVPGSILWRRLELLGPREHLRWLTVP
ncbi:MAG: PIG-L deacetylase family protein [Actinomycetes bacterium]